MARPPAPDGTAVTGLARWAASGGMWLTGTEDGPPTVPPGDVLAVADGWVRQLGPVGPLAGRPAGPVVEEALFARSALRGLRRRGRTSPGGTAVLHPAADGWVAVNLARPSDRAAVGAVLGRTVAPDRAEAALADGARRLAAAELVDRAQELGIPAAVVPDQPPAGRRAVRIATVAPGRGPVVGAPLVVDLSALWAGPLAARVLGGLGARVVKVESPHRPDGSRSGDPRFAGWLNQGHATVALDPGVVEQRRHLQALVARADVVISAARPRALEQMGLDPASVVTSGGGTWIAISGYGADGPHRVAFGDDAAAAGGLVGRDAAGDPVFCGDAIADPLTGLAAAAAAVTALEAGGGRVLEVAMADVAAAAAGGPALPPATVRRVGADWVADLDDASLPILPPGPGGLVGAGPIRPLGADTAAVLDELGICS